MFKDFDKFVDKFKIHYYIQKILPPQSLQLSLDKLKIAYFSRNKLIFGI